MIATLYAHFANAKCTQRNDRTLENVTQHYLLMQNLHGAVNNAMMGYNPPTATAVPLPLHRGGR